MNNGNQSAPAGSMPPAVLVDRSGLALFKITGASRLAILDRISTQAVKGLQSGQGTATVLTTDIGRIIDRLLLYASSDAIYALAGEGHRDPLARYLLRNVFFTDDFQLQDVTAETAVFGVYGPNAAARLAAAGFPETDLPRHHWRQVDVAGVTAYLHRTDPIGGDGYFVMCTTASRDAVWQHLRQHDMQPIDEAEFEYWRIAAGQPRFGRELTLEYIPLEANLWSDVSFDKGCYTGQEIIARMESRGRLAKRLVPLQPAAPLAPDAPLTANGKRVGTVTSAADGPQGAVALGYVKTAALASAEALQSGETAVRWRDPDAA